MKIDTRFPTKLNTVSDAPEPFRSALAESLPSGEPVRFLVHAPSFTTGDEKSPATVLAVTNNGWLIASETEGGRPAIEKSDFGDTLFVELKSILLFGQIRIAFAAGESSRSAAIKFEMVEEDFHQEAIDLVLAGIDPEITGIAEKDRSKVSIFRNWPLKVRNEAQRYSPRGQPLLAALEWPPIFDVPQRELAPARALLITKRELVVISEENPSPAELPPEKSSTGEPKERLGEIITFVPRVRVAGFNVSHQGSFDVLALQVRGTHGGENLEINLPSDEAKAVSNAMEQMLRTP
jgi:hypothetical protein